jgi:hypothetical protein
MEGAPDDGGDGAADVEAGLISVWFVRDRSRC